MKKSFVLKERCGPILVSKKLSLDAALMMPNSRTIFCALGRRREGTTTTTITADKQRRRESEREREREREREHVEKLREEKACSECGTNRLMALAVTYNGEPSS